MSEQPTHTADKLTSRSANTKTAEVTHKTHQPEARTQRPPPHNTRGIGHNALVVVQPLTTSRTVSLG